MGEHRALGAWLRDVTGMAVLASAGALALGGAAGAVVLAVPARGQPLVAGLAALAVVLGTGRVLVARARPGISIVAGTGSLPAGPARPSVPGGSRGTIR